MEVMQLQLQLAQPGTNETAKLQARREEATQRYWAIEQLPTWPVDARTRRRFGLNNIALLLPLVSEVLGQTALWQQLAEVLRAWEQ